MLMAAVLLTLVLFACYTENCHKRNTADVNMSIYRHTCYSETHCTILTPLLVFSVESVPMLTIFMATL